MTGTTVTTTARTPLRLPIDDELVVRTRQALKFKILDALEEGHRHIVLDASQCGYIDSSGLGVLVSIDKKCREAGGSLVIEGLRADMRRWMAFVKLDTVLTIEPPITDAERAGE